MLFRSLEDMRVLDNDPFPTESVGHRSIPDGVYKVALFTAAKEQALTNIAGLTDPVLEFYWEGYVTGDNQQSLFKKASGVWVYLNDTNRAVKLELGLGGECYTTLNDCPKGWHTIQLIRDYEGDNWRCYIDGQEEAMSGSTTITTYNNDWGIGKGGQSSVYDDVNCRRAYIRKGDWQNPPQNVKTYNYIENGEVVFPIDPEVIAYNSPETSFAPILSDGNDGLGNTPNFIGGYLHNGEPNITLLQSNFGASASSNGNPYLWVRYDNGVVSHEQYLKWYNVGGGTWSSPTSPFGTSDGIVIIEYDTLGLEWKLDHGGTLPDTTSPLDGPLPPENGWLNTDWTVRVGGQEGTPWIDADGEYVERDWDSIERRVHGAKNCVECFASAGAGSTKHLKESVIFSGDVPQDSTWATKTGKYLNSNSVESVTTFTLNNGDDFVLDSGALFIIAK